MKKSLLLFALSAPLCGSIGLQAQTYQQVAPQVPSAGPAPSTTLAAPTTNPAPSVSTTALVLSLRGLVFLSSPAQLKPAGVSTPGLDLKATPLLDTPAYRQQLQAALGQPATLTSLRALTDAAITTLRSADRPVVEVIVPEQNVQSGVIQILVIEGRLGKVTVQGNKFFKSDMLAAQVRTQPGQPISGGSLQDDLDWLNNNPFRQVSGVFARSDQAGETDLILQVNDRQPGRIYAGWDRTGSAITDENRLFAGINWGQAFGLDDQLNYQLTASPDFKKMLAHSFSYVAPLPWRDTLTVFGSYATSRPDIPNFNLKGVTWQLGLRYHTPLATLGQVHQSIAYGLDVKNSNNNLAFGGQSVFAQQTQIVELSLGYNANLADKLGVTTAAATLYWNPGGIGPSDGTSDFEQSRAGAKADFGYANLVLTRDTRLPGSFVWHIEATGQIASGPLLGSEQLGFGGEDSVRGYEEREVNGDSGVVVQNELRRSINLKQGGVLTPFVFVDWGVSVTSKPQPGDPRNTTLAGTGVGVRYQFRDNIIAATDYGWQLKDSGVSPTGDTGRWDASVTLAY